MNVDLNNLNRPRLVKSQVLLVLVVVIKGLFIIVSVGMEPRLNIVSKLKSFKGLVGI